MTLGNLAGDMIRNAELEDLHPEVRKGVQVHRAIDSFTDRHDEIRDLVSVLRPVHGKYAPVAVDVILDYVLSSDWEHHTGLPFDVFTGWVYETIDDYGHLLPDRVLPRVTGMRTHQWLEQYRTQDGLLHVLKRMDQRARFPSRFAEGLQDLDTHYNDLKRGLRSFYPDLLNYSAELMAAEDRSTLRSEGRS